MRKLSIFNRQGFPAFLFCFLYISMSFLISSCGGGGGGDADSSSELSETASASFTIAWHNGPGIQTSENSLITTQAGPVNCDLIQNIICEVYDGSNTYLTSEVFECSARQGRIDHIPPGEDRVFVILAEDIDGNILYHGEVSGITITAGETNDLGIIDCFYFVPTLLSPDNNSDVILDQFSLNWTSVETAYEYGVQVSEGLDFETMVIDETTPNIQYTPSGLSESTTYYWRVFARDIHANQGMESQEVWSFNVIPGQEVTYSISPASRSFEFGGGAGSISVTASATGGSWTATESVDWITITSGSTGNSNGTVTYTVSENTTNEERTAIITVAGQTHTVTQGVPGQCTYSILPTSQSFTSSGGTGSISVTSSATTCTWTATSSDSWINITSGTPGTGNGTVSYTVSSNTTGSSRTGTINVAGQILTVTQLGECTYSILPTSQSFTSSGGTGSISVTSSATTCTWTATPSDIWINITSGGSGIGNGTVTYTVSSNTTELSRTGTINVAGQTHTVTQPPPGPCTYFISPMSQSFASSGGTGNISVTASSSTCSWTASESVSWITITSGTPGTGNGTVTYTVSSNTTGSSKTGTINVAGQAYTVTQSGCTYSISPTSQSFTSSGGTGNISVTASSSTCSWTASVSESWITITSGSSGTGNGTATYTVSINTTGSSRTGTINVAGQIHTVTQQPALVISGYVVTSSGAGISGVTLTFSNKGGTATTDSSGYYYKYVFYGWSGTVTPTNSCYTFEPSYRSYRNVTSNQSSQNYTGTIKTYYISGYVVTSSGAGISGVTLTFSNKGGTATTDSYGYYYKYVSCGWTGTVTPTKSGYTFSPSYRSYSNVTSNYYTQNYTGGISDLVITTGSPTVTPSTIWPGGSVTLSSWTVRNQGTAASGSFSNGFYLSTDTLISPADTYLTGNSNYSLAPGEQFAWGGPTLTIPAGTIPGTYYIGILVDRDNAVAEYNESNNYVSRQITVVPSAFLISGYVQTKSGDGISGVTLTFSNSGGTATTDSSGYYYRYVSYGWTGTVTPSMVGYTLYPSSRSYSNVTSNYASQNYEINPINLVISGYVRYSSGTGISGVTLTFSNSGGTATTDSYGYYYKYVSYGWTGTVTPTPVIGTSDSLLFSPSSRSYSNVTSNYGSQNYTGYILIGLLPMQIPLEMGKTKQTLLSAMEDQRMAIR